MEIQKDQTQVSPVIRPLRSHDVQNAKSLIRAVWREHFETHEELFVREYLLLPDALNDVDGAVLAADPTSLFLVQEVSGLVVATGAIHGVSREVCELTRMFVAPAWRGRGLAKALTRCLLDFASEKNFKTVRLASNTQLAASHKLYRAFGFRDCSAWDPEDDGHSVFMQLSL